MMVSLLPIEVQQPTISDHNLHLKKMQTSRDNDKNASDRLDERMIRSRVKNICINSTKYVTKYMPDAKKKKARKSQQNT